MASIISAAASTEPPSSRTVASDCDPSSLLFRRFRPTGEERRLDHPLTMKHLRQTRWYTSENGDKLASSPFMPSRGQRHRSSSELGSSSPDHGNWRTALRRWSSQRIVASPTRLIAGERVRSSSVAKPRPQNEARHAYIYFPGGSLSELISHHTSILSTSHLVLQPVARFLIFASIDEPWVTNGPTTVVCPSSLRGQVTWLPRNRLRVNGTLP